MPLGKNVKITTKRIAVCSILIAVSIVLGFVEKLLPIDSLIFGFKLGFANIVVIFALYKLKLIDAFFVCIMKIFLSGLAFSGPVYFLYSLSGGLLSFAIMLLLRKKLSVITVSILGAVFFNIGQIICACVLLSTSVIITYIPFLTLVGVITGALIGMISNTAIKRIRI